MPHIILYIKHLSLTHTFMFFLAINYVSSWWQTLDNWNVVFQYFHTYVDKILFAHQVSLYSLMLHDEDTFGVYFNKHIKFHGCERRAKFLGRKFISAMFVMCTWHEHKWDVINLKITNCGEKERKTFNNNFAYVA
jgi:hypothetical protein